MSYTPEQLREWADRLDAAHENEEDARLFRAYADALDEIERLQKALLRAVNETDYGHLISAEDFYGVFVRARAALAAIREAK